MNEGNSLGVKILLVIALLICALLLGYLLKDLFPSQKEEVVPENFYQIDLKAIEEDVSLLRGLPLKEEIPVEFLNKESLFQELRKSIQEELSSEDLKSQERLLRFLGILDDPRNLEDILLEVLSEQVYGFYEQETGELKVLKKEEKVSALEHLALVHEIEHAIQDQNFDLSRFLPPEFKGNDDQLLAAQSLFEGDASWTSLLYVQNNKRWNFSLGLLLDSLSVNQSSLESAPQYVVESLLFPYQDGMNFVKTLYEKGGWDLVNRAFEAPPSSSEQIIHPVKYLSNEGYEEIVFPQWESLQGFSLSRDNSLGEFDFRFLFKSLLPEGQAESAAQGWNGCRYQFWEGMGKAVFILEARWDSLQDASEAQFALENFLKDRFGFAPILYYQGSLYRGQNEVGVLYPSGKSIYLILAPEEAMALSILEELP